MERQAPLLALAALLLLCGLALSGCALVPVPPAAEAPSPTKAQSGAATPVVAPTAASSGDATTPGEPAAPADAATLLHTAWQKSGHADSFVAESNGQNNECARCHSPWNWLPTLSADLPMNCTACKFNLPDPEPIPQAEWKSVGCEVCHRVEGEIVEPEPAWLNSLVAQFETATDPWEPVQSAAELCEKCHRDYGTQHAARDLGTSVHQGFDCIQCHDAHSAEASCIAAGCHPDTLQPATPIAGHDKDHANVTCVACHDASGSTVGPAEDKTWTPLRDASMPGQTGQVPYLSHNLQRTVDCARCHFAGNPWQLQADKH